MHIIHGSLGSLRVIEHFLPISLFHSLRRRVLQLFLALDGKDASIFLVLRMVFSLLREELILVWVQILLKLSNR